MVATKPSQNLSAKVQRPRRPTVKKSKRERIKSTFQKAQRLTNTGQYGRASQLLRHIISNMDSHDAHSYLALGRLESRRELATQSHEATLFPNLALYSKMGAAQRSEEGATEKKQSAPTTSWASLLQGDDSANMAQEPAILPFLGPEFSRNTDRPSLARKTFQQGVKNCPDSIHLWQAWAIHEQNLGDYNKAKELYQRALEIDSTNPYVCHAFGLMMLQRLGDSQKAKELWNSALERHSTAALVCSLGELELSEGHFDAARQIYATHLPRLRAKSTRWRRRNNGSNERNNNQNQDAEREEIEVYLAAAWLEEKWAMEHGDKDDVQLQTAEDILQEALRYYPQNSRILVALARLQARNSGESDRKALQQSSNYSGIEDKNVPNNNLASDRDSLSTDEAKSVVKSESSYRTPEAEADAMTSLKLAEACEKMLSGASNSYDEGEGISHTMNSSTKENEKRKLSKESIRSQKAAQLMNNKKRKASSSSFNFSPSSDGRVYNAWAKVEVKEGRLRNAKRILLEGTKKFASDHSLYQALGRVEQRLGNFDRARECFAESLRLQPSAPALVAYAMLEWRHPGGMVADQKRQKFDKDADDPTIPPKANLTMVEKLFEEALLVDPRHGPTYNAYGSLALRQGDVGKARRIFASGVRANCNDPASVYHGFAKLELAANNIDFARRILVAGLQVVQRQQEGLRMIETQQRQQHRAHFLVHTLGMLELKQSNILQAKDVFMKGIEQYGNSSQLLLGAALCDLKLGQQSSARKFFKRAVQVDRRHAHAWHAWGIMEQRAGNYKTARTLFDKGLQNCPKHASLWQSYAAMERRSGNIKTSRILYAAGVAKCPNHTALYQGWASLELQVENFVSAKKLIGEALTRDKTHGPGWLIAARIEESQGSEALAGLILRRGLEYAPTSPELYSALAALLLKQRKVPEARDLLERGLDANPTNAPLYHALAELEASVFNLDGLAKLNKRASAIFSSNALEPPKSRQTTNVWDKGPESDFDTFSEVNLSGITSGDSMATFSSALAHADPDKILKDLSRWEDNVVNDVFSFAADDMEEDRTAKQKENMSDEM